MNLMFNLLTDEQDILLWTKDQIIRFKSLTLLPPHLVSILQGNSSQFGSLVDNQGVMWSRKVAHGGERMEPPIRFIEG